ncbi:MAG: ImmA/IrrE family metallo-endopeptidase [Propionibacterium acidifaciens]|uniref:ImmA/IrrE family metallo-endopeptidase n=1 Tax=Propionibacterium acidifaciens TaxID=556499 RepID=UPI003609F4A8
MRSREWWAVEQAALPSGQSGRVDWARRVVTVDCRLSAAQRRCTLAHELVHVERGPVPADPWLAAREEAAVEAEAARRLIGIDALADALAWSSQPAEIADELGVDVQTLMVRVGGLSVAERRAVGLWWWDNPILP